LAAPVRGRAVSRANEAAGGVSREIEGLETVAEGACDRQGFERGADDMRRTHAVGVVRRLGGEELGVGEDDAQLIIEAMKERRKIARVEGGRAIFSHGPQGKKHEFLLKKDATRPSSATTSAGRQAAATTNP